MRILSIETSCDETALSIVECSGGVKHPRFKVLKNLINSQIPIHRPFGGVVPNLAKREHIKNLPLLLKKFKIQNSKFKIDAIAVTVGPGLEPALWTGIEFAKQLAKDLKKPLLGANHMEGHVFSVLLNAGISNDEFRISKKNSKFKIQNSKFSFPAIGLVVSGGHTMLIKMDSYTKWKKLGETRDDAVGEAFDKVARLLGLQYPGGPEISKLAKKGNAKAISFPRPMINSQNYEFSFSGLKTAVLYYLRGHSPFSKGSTRQQAGEGFQKSSVAKGDHPPLSKEEVAASFQQACLDVLVKKTMRAASEFGAKTVFICGGVAANQLLRHQLSVMCHKSGVGFLSPAAEFNTDNAAMIAAAAYLAYLRKKKYKMVADSTMSL